MSIDSPHGGGEASFSRKEIPKWASNEEIIDICTENFAWSINERLSIIFQSADKKKKEIQWNIQKTWTDVKRAIRISTIQLKIRELNERLDNLSTQQIWTFLMQISELFQELEKLSPRHNNTYNFFEVFQKVSNCTEWFIFTDWNGDYVVIDHDFNICRFPYKNRRERF